MQYNLLDYFSQYCNRHPKLSHVMEHHLIKHKVAIRFNESLIWNLPSCVFVVYLITLQWWLKYEKVSHKCHSKWDGSFSHWSCWGFIFFWDVILCHWVNATILLRPLWLYKLRALCSFKTLGTAHLMTQRHIPEDVSATITFCRSEAEKWVQFWWMHWCQERHFSDHFRL
jgi:hypothetical protein